MERTSGLPHPYITQQWQPSPGASTSQQEEEPNPEPMDIVEPGFDTSSITKGIIENSKSLQNKVPDSLPSLLDEIINLTIESKTINKLEDFSGDQRQRAMRIRQQKNKIKIEFIETCKHSGIELELDDDEFPLIFNEINRQADNCAEQKVAFEKRSIIQAWRKNTNSPDQLAGNALDQLYGQCMSEKSLAKTTHSKLDYLIEHAKIPEHLSDEYKLQINYYDTDMFEIEIDVSGNLRLAYGIHDLLRSKEIINDEQQYDGELNFIISTHHLEVLNKHLDEVIKYSDDFVCIIGDLLGNNKDNNDVDSALQFVATGSKSSDEIITLADRLTFSCFQKIKGIDSTKPFLLFNTMAINLAHHDDRVYLRNLFQELYTKNKLHDSKNEEKKFMKDTFSSNINVKQLELICPTLNKLLKLQQLLTAFTGEPTLNKALTQAKLQGLFDDTYQIMKTFKISSIYDTFRIITGNNLAIYSEINTKIIRGVDLDDIEKISLDVCLKLLHKTTAIKVRFQTETFTPDADQIKALYSNKPAITTYEDGQNHIDVRKLMTCLENCEAYRRNKQPGDTDDALKELVDVLVDRLNKYKQLPRESYAGQKMVDEAVDYFKDYVCKMRYADLYSITDDSIQKSLMQLIGLSGSDLRQGCNQGLAGRVQSILQPLVSSAANNIENCIKQYQQDALNTSFEAVTRDSRSESSMFNDEKIEAAVFLQIDVNTRSVEPTPYQNLIYDTKRIVHHYLKKSYSTVALYEKVYAFLKGEIWRLNSNKEDEQMYELFHLLGFEHNNECSSENEEYRNKLNNKYRARENALNRWQYAFIQQDLPFYIIRYLLREQFIVPKTNMSATQTEIHSDNYGSFNLPEDLHVGDMISNEPDAPFQTIREEENMQFGMQMASEMTRTHSSTIITD